ncbi:MAG: FtsQ-type POTRA domain-containing protein [Candidatus Neomarinimicrobiota bacterium]
MTNKERHSRDRRKQIRTLLIIIIFLALVVIYCRSQQVFTVENIEVSGQFELSDREIERISGIKRGANIFDLNLVQGIENLMQEPYINKVYIYREFPNKVKINVIERHPIVLIELAKDYAIDAFATMLPSPKSYPSENLPIIRGVDPSLAFELGKLCEQQDILNAIVLLNYVSTSNKKILEYCSNMRWSEKNGWTIRKSLQYPEIHLGKNNLIQKINILEAFINKMEDENKDIKKIKYINLRFEKQIIVREK